jgi:hypothetical protein
MLQGEFNNIINNKIEIIIINSITELRSTYY